MSRYFVRCFYTTYTKTDSCEKPIRFAYPRRSVGTRAAKSTWTQRISLPSFLSVVSEGHRLYKDTLDLKERAEEPFSDIFWEDWVDAGSSDTFKSRVLTEDVMESLVYGKYAPFRASDDDASEGLCKAVARFPELKTICEANGYQFDNVDQSRIFLQTFESFENDHLARGNSEELYERICSLLKLFPAWKADAFVCKALFLVRPLSNSLPFLCMTDRERLDDLIPSSIKVIHRLHETTTCFQDLRMHLPAYIDSEIILCYHARRDLACLCILFQYFPDMLDYCIDTIGLQLLHEYSHILKLPQMTAEQLKIARECLPEMLYLIKLSPEHLLTSFQQHHDIFASISPILQHSFYGPVLKRHFTSIVDLILEGCIDGSGESNQLQMLDTTIENLCQDSTLRIDDWEISEDFLSKRLSIIILKRAFDLDILQADDNNATINRFKTHIAWLQEGSITCSTADQYGRSCTDLKPHDPYGLIPGKDKSLKKDQHGDQVKLTFFIVGARPQLQADSLNMELKDCDKNFVEEENIIASHSSSKEDDADQGGYPTKEIEVFRMYCSNADECKNRCKKKEPMGDAIARHLDADDPAMRDVFMAHALVNGNVELLEKLMGKVNRSKGKKKDSAIITKDAEAVLPTLAHLCILQKMNRAPLQVFIDSILQGAPFQRGYVKSSLAVRQKEMNVEKRREWYKKRGCKDDRPFTALYKEKERLLGSDTITYPQRIDDSSSSFSTPTSSKQQAHDPSTDSETEEEDEEGTAPLHAPQDDHPAKIFVNRGVRYKMTVREMHRRSKSLQVWLDHLRLLQWFDERDQRQKTTPFLEEHASQMSFSCGLIAMVKQLEVLDAAIRNQIEKAKSKPEAEVEETEKATAGKNGSRKGVNEDESDIQKGGKRRKLGQSAAQLADEGEENKVVVEGSTNKVEIMKGQQKRLTRSARKTLVKSAGRDQ